MGKFRQWLESHGNLLAKYNDPESRLLISKGIHPGTLEPISPEDQPAYGLAGYDQPPAAEEPKSKIPQGYKVMEPTPGAGGKDKWGRKIYNKWDHPEYLARQNDIYKKLRKPIVRSPGGGDPTQEKDQYGRRMGYPLADK